MSALLRHIGTVHSYQAGFRVVCGIDGCPRTYDNYSSFCKHLRRKHMDSLGVEPLEVLQSEEMCEADTLIDGACDDSSEETRKRNAVLFVLKNKEIHKTSQIALNGLISDFTLLTEQTIDCLSSKVISVLERNGINYKDVEGLDEMLSDERLCNPFFGLQSAHLQRKAYHSLGLVVSIYSIFVYVLCFVQRKGPLKSKSPQ